MQKYRSRTTLIFKTIDKANEVHRNFLKVDVCEFLFVIVIVLRFWFRGAELQQKQKKTVQSRLILRSFEFCNKFRASKQHYTVFNEHKVVCSRKIVT